MTNAEGGQELDGPRASLSSSGADAPVSFIPIRRTDSSEFSEFEADQATAAFQFTSLSVPAGKSMRIDATLGYRRCYDFDATNSRGQDALLLRANGEYLVGVLADGVSQSFFGDIAAKALSRRVTEMLWRLRQAPPPLADMEKSLLHLQGEVAEEVARFPLPARLPEMQVAALDSARQRGSQAVFAAFVFDVARRTIAIYQVGDVSSFVKSGSNEFMLSTVQSGRWSSAANSRLELVCAPFTDVSSVLIKSDGAADAWGRNIQSLRQVSGEAFLSMARDRAAKDDVSFLRIALSDASSATEELPPVRYTAPPPSPSPSPSDNAKPRDPGTRTEAKGGNAPPRQAPSASWPQSGSKPKQDTYAPPASLQLRRPPQEPSRRAGFGFHTLSFWIGFLVGGLAMLVITYLLSDVPTFMSYHPRQGAGAEQRAVASHPNESSRSARKPSSP